MRIALVLPSLIVVCMAGVGALHAAPTNDDFARAGVMIGNNPVASGSINGAGLEPGEPAHLNGAACKSIWWSWQAPVRGIFTFYTQNSTATKITIAIYTGDSVDALSLVAKANTKLRFDSAV